MLVCRDSEPAVEGADPVGAEVEKWVAAMDARGVRITGAPLAPEERAAVVRVRGEKVKVGEGAILKTEGALLGFDLLECRDLNEAIEVASAHPLARRCVLEIRPVNTD